MTAGRPLAPAQAYVVLSTQRSGTAWVVERLESHPEVAAYGELMLPRHEGRPTWPPDRDDILFFSSWLAERGVSRGSTRRARVTHRYLDELYRKPRAHGAVGFKLMYSDLKSYPEVVAYLVARRVKVLHLIRANHLDVVLSRRALARRGKAHAWEGGQVESVTIRLEPAELLAELSALARRQQFMRRAMRALPVSVLELTYETLLESDEPMSAAYGFLGVESAAGHSHATRMVKLAGKSHREQIENFDEVRAGLARTPYASLLRP